MPWEPFEEPCSATSQANSLYASLGVPIKASEQEIRRAYRRLVLTLHPDRCSDEGAAARFQQIHAAYEVLRDRRRRAEYDQRLICEFCVEEYLRRFKDLVLTAQGLSLPMEEPQKQPAPALPLVWARG